MFRSTSDTEVLLHLYEDVGLELSRTSTACSPWLSGMRRAAACAGPRPAGQKPLVYRQEPGRLLFASELKSLLAVAGVPRESIRRRSTSI